MIVFNHYPASIVFRFKLVTGIKRHVARDSADIRTQRPERYDIIYIFILELLKYTLWYNYHHPQELKDRIGK